MKKRYVNETSAAKSVSAYLVLTKGGTLVAKVQAHFANSGGVLVNVFNVREGEFGCGYATGYGYDKFTAALAGLEIDGHLMTDHCSTHRAPKPPKGAPGYPIGIKPRKGYRFENPVVFCRDDADSPWRQLSIEERAALRRASMPTMAEAVEGLNAREREYVEKVAAMRAAGNTFKAFMSCHRESGLDYLKALGYQVIQAI